MRFGAAAAAVGRAIYWLSRRPTYWLSRRPTYWLSRRPTYWLSRRPRPGHGSHRRRSNGGSP